MQNLPEILLWLYVINLGVAFGAGIYEARIILPQWFIPFGSDLKVNTQAINQTDVGRRFWAMVTTIPLTLLTIANLAIALKSTGARHDWLLASTVIILIERISTFTFFIPTIIKLAQLENLAISKQATLWVRVNYFRNLLTLLGWLAALKVLTLPV